MSILDLSYELLLLITDNLTVPADLFALLQTHRGIAVFVAPVLEKYAAKPAHSIAALFCHAAYRNRAKVEASLTLLSPSRPTSSQVTAAVDAGPNFSFTSLSWHTARTQRALHWAVTNNKPAMTTFLIKKGASIDHRSPTTGGTALDHAISLGNSTIVQLLIIHGATVTAHARYCGTLLHCTIFSRRKILYAERDLYFDEILTHLLTAGVDLTLTNSLGHTPLHLAVLSWTSAVPKLLAWGADVNARDNNGDTPLHLAALHPGSNEMVGVLLRGGADPTLRNLDRMAPICFCGPQTSEEAFQLLGNARGAHRCGRNCGGVRRAMGGYEAGLLALRYPR